jgi:hypothetical protein
MAKSKKTKELKKDNRVLTAPVTIDAPSGEGKVMQVRTVFAHRKVLEALEENRGHIKKACEEAGITRTTFYEYMKDPDFAEAVEHVKEGITDDYMEALHACAIDAKFFAAIKYWLDNHAQKRGFGKDLLAAQTPQVTTNVQVNQVSVKDLPVETLKLLRDSLKKS